MKISKKEKILCLILSALVIIVAIFAVVPRFTVIDDIDRFDELKIGNKVIFGRHYCNNTWRVEWKWGTKVLLVNEKSLQDSDFSGLEHAMYSPNCVMPVIGSIDDHYEDQVVNVYLDNLNGNYYDGNFNSEEKMMMCDISPKQHIFIRAKCISGFNLTRGSIDDHKLQLKTGFYKYYPAVWIDTAVIKSNK